MSISRDQLIQFIEKPGLLKENTIGDLKEIVDEFPYFQSAQLLYTFNLFAQSNFRYASYLKTCSIYATDRTILYQLLQPDDATHSAPELPLPIDNNEEGTSLFFELSEEKQITQAEFPVLSQFQSSELETLGFDLLSFDQPDTFFPIEEQMEDSQTVNDVANTDTSDFKVDAKVDLIEQFINSKPTIQPKMEGSLGNNEISMLKDEPDNENDEFITETLSRIYLKQGHYQKAIDSFKRLSLKFPEKSVYFAQQIEEIKKLLN